MMLPGAAGSSTPEGTASEAASKAASESSA